MTELKNIEQLIDAKSNSLKKDVERLVDKKLVPIRKDILDLKDIEQLIDAKLKPIKKDILDILKDIKSIEGELLKADDIINKLNTRIERIDSNLTGLAEQE